MSCEFFSLLSMDSLYTGYNKCLIDLSKREPFLLPIPDTNWHEVMLVNFSDQLIVSLVFKRSKERIYRFPAERVGVAAGYFRKRSKDKKPLFHTGVREDQMIRLQDKVIVEQEIEIKGSVLPLIDLRISPPAMSCLNRLQQVQEGMRCQPCPHKGSSIDKPVGTVHAYRLTVKKRGMCQGKDAGVRKYLLPGRLENCLRLPHIGPQADGGFMQLDFLGSHTGLINHINRKRLNRTFY